VGKIGDLPGRANTATSAPKHSDAIIIGNFAVAGDDCAWKESFLVSLRKLHASFDGFLKQHLTISVLASIRDRTLA